jgi:hypothetical protein
MSGRTAQSNGHFREHRVEPPAGSYSGLRTSVEFMAAMQPPAFLVDGLIQRGFSYTFTGPTGHGKTLVALLLAASVARGSSFCGLNVRQGSVLFLAGENPDNVRYQWFGLADHLGFKPCDLPVYWHPGHFGLTGAADRLAKDAARIPNLRLIFADTLQAFFEGDDDNSNPEMLASARSFRSLTQLPSRPAVLVPAHPIKNARRDALLPRGGSALLNEVDGNLTIWRDDAIATLHWYGKIRGPNFDPLRFEMVRTEPAGLVDEEGRQMPCTVVRPLLTDREEQIVRENISRENRALEAIRDKPSISLAGLGDIVGCSKSSADRLVKRLLDDLKWIKKKGRAYVLTADGTAALDG